MDGDLTLERVASVVALNGEVVDPAYAESTYVAQRRAVTEWVDVPAPGEETTDA